MIKNKSEDIETKTKSEDKKELLIVTGMLLLLAVLFLIFGLFRNTSDTSASDTPTSYVYFNEIMTNNSSYPDQRGVFGDWAELHNSSNHDIDISGYVVYDGNLEQYLILPENTVIKAKGYLMISFGGGEGQFTAPFALSKKGDETLILANTLNSIVDSVTIKEMEKDTVMIRNTSGNWTISSTPTPLFENDYEKFKEYISQLQSSNKSLVINEVMSSNLGRIHDDDSEAFDWIEIKNVSDTPVDLSNYFLSDNQEFLCKSQLPDKILVPNETIVLFAAGEKKVSNNYDYLNFKISSTGENLYLSDWRGVLSDSIEIPPIPANYSYALSDNGEYIISEKQTPNRENNYVSNSSSSYSNLLINEVCPANKAGLRDANGNFSDWIEIGNLGSTSISLGNVWLSVDRQNVYQFKLPDITLESGAYLLVFTGSEKTAEGELHAGFSMSSHGECITLYTYDGYLIDSFEYSEISDDRIYTRQSKGESVTVSDFITPGYANTLQGHISYMKTLKANSSIIINEVMTSNSTVCPQEFGEHYDWIEIANNSNESLNLSEYSLTDNLSFSELCTLPNITLVPGQTFLIFCSGDSSKTTNKAFHAGFTLSAEYSPLYLLKDGLVVDNVALYNIPPDTSYGRMPNQNGFYYFESPTPGSRNKGGVYGMSHKPVPSLKGGVYQTEDELIVELYSSGQIYYTLDGTIPSKWSTKYTEPIVLSKSSVIRAITIEPNMLVSSVVTTSYFLNVEHSLPILSLSVNPNDMFNPETGIYVEGNSPNGNYYMNWEKDANLTFFDTNGGSFSIDCGLKMHGGGSRRSDNKKSLKVIFRPCYGQSSLTYDLFGENTPSEFSSLVIRAGEDYRYTIFRSELITGLAKEANPNALTQDHKYCVLYLNGDYFGVFALMERYNEEYYAARYNVTPDSVTIVDAINIQNSEFMNLIDFCENNDMSKTENYDYICDNVDIDLLIDWYIFESYSGNTDTVNNARIMQSTEGDAKWRYCFYDLDWTFRSPEPTFYSASGNYHLIYALPNYLFKNDEFKQQMISRAEELRYGVLSNENVLEKINEYDRLLYDELILDRIKWHLPMSIYETRLETLRSMVRDYDRWESLINSLYSICGYK